MTAITDVDVDNYYDGILSGSLVYDGLLCRFELASGCEPTSNAERRYIVLCRGKVIATARETDLRALAGRRTM